MSRARASWIGGLIFAAVVLGAGCTKKPTAPVLAPAPPAAHLVATSPPARSTAFYDTPIWAQFDRPLDPKTVNATTVFLKLDTQRIASTIRYDSGTRRITVTPSATLLLHHTYTVEFTTNLHALDGTPVPENTFFQFTTNSLFRLTAAFPALDALESPFAALGWTGNGAPVDSIYYDVYAGLDSAAVAQHNGTLKLHTVYTTFLPRVRWPANSLVYWTVTAQNLKTLEHIDSPVVRFRTADPSLPGDTVYVTMRDYGAANAARSEFCTNTQLPCGNQGASAVVCGIHWSLSGAYAGRILQDAEIELTPKASSVPNIPYVGLHAWIAYNDWNSCGMIFPGPPYPDATGDLGVATLSPASLAVVHTDYLAAFVDAQRLGRGTFNGTLLTCSGSITFDMAAGVPHIRLVLQR